MGESRIGARLASRWLRGSVAFVWLTTGVMVLHPYYREVASGYLAFLGPGLGTALMWSACGLSVLLALRVALGPSSDWLVAGQVAILVASTVVLALSDPMLLVHPMGVLSKNLPIACVLGTAWWLEREGPARRDAWSKGALNLLRFGMGVVWITEGIFPKILFQQEMELAIARESALVLIDPSLFLTLLGAAQALSGVLAFTLRGRLLRALLYIQGAALVALPLLAAWNDVQPWVHPLGPLTKTVPLAIGTFVLVLHLRDSETDMKAAT